MTDLSPESRGVLDRFGQQPSVTPSHVAMLYSVVNGSPALEDQFNAAVAAGHLREFSLLPADTHAGGTYSGSDKTINLPVRLLAPRVGSEAYGAAELTFVLGHEIQHGFNHEATSAAYSKFNEDVRVAANGNHDHTEAVSDLISANRRDEASAQLSGWNALVGMVRSANPNATLRDVYDANLRSRDFLTVNDATGDPVVRPQLALSPDMTLRASDANLEGMGQLYFDKQPHQSALGHHGNSDYANYYGAYAVGVAARAEAANATPDAPVPMRLDMRRLGLQESLMEQNGIWLGPGSPAPQPYMDTSNTPPSLHHFDHTHSTNTHIPIAAQEQERRRGSDATSEEPARLQISPVMSQRDEELHSQIRDHVSKLDAANGRVFDDTSERLTASLLVVAKQNGIERVDHVLLSQPTAELPASHNIFIVQGDLTDPASLRASTATAQAAQQPLQQSREALEVVNLKLADEAAQEQSRDQQRGLEHQRASVPGL